MNKYEVINLIGEGTYGVVLKCRHKESGEIVAIKKFKDTEAHDETLRKTTKREVEMLKKLRQDNIIELRESFRRKGKLHLVFEYFEKNLLETLQARSSGLPPELVRFFMYQLVSAIHYCHENNVIHRDIKPENLLINPDHSLKLCDFGFARYAPRSEDDSMNESPLTDYVATRWYRSPELLVGYSHYSFPVDIWSMGCIMAEMIDGSPLFPGETEIDQLYIIQKIQGPLSPEQTNLFYRNPNFKGFKFPDMSNPKDSLDRKFSGMLCPAGFSLLKGLLRMDPIERLTSRECLAHEYFRGMNTDSIHRQLRTPLGIHEELMGEKRNTSKPKLVKPLPTLGQHKTHQQESKSVIDVSDLPDRRPLKKTKENRMKSPQQGLSYADVVGQRITKTREKKSKRRSKYVEDFQSNRELNEGLSKVYRNEEGKENRERIFIKQKKPRSKSKSGYYQMESVFTPRGFSRTPEVNSNPEDIDDDKSNNSMNPIGSLKAPTTKAQRVLADNSNYYSNSIIEDIEFIEYQSKESPRQKSARRKLNPYSNPMQSFIPTTPTPSQFFSSPSMVIPSQTQLSSLKQEGFSYSSKPQRLPSATLSRAGSSTNVIQKPLTKPGLESTYPQVTKQVQTQQFVKPPTRKNSRKNQNFMMPLNGNIDRQYSYLHTDSRPGTSNGNYAGEVGTLNHAHKNLHPLGMNAIETASIGRTINDW